MRLSECMQDIPYRSIRRMQNPEIKGITDDSRSAGPGILFFGIRGTKTDGRCHLADAAKQGAICVTDGSIPDRKTELPYLLQVADARRAYAICCQNFYRHPERFLVTVAVSGTKGKTSTAFLIQSILQAAGRKCGLVGSEGIRIGSGQFENIKNTTPEPGILFSALRKMVEAGCSHVVIEVSSQAMKQHRTGTMQFDYGVFTNFSEDHIGKGEHADLEEYRFWKEAFVRSCRRLVCHLPEWRQLFAKKKFPQMAELVCFGEEETEDCSYSLLQTEKKKKPFSGTVCCFSYLSGQKRRKQRFEIRLFGEHQVWNALAAFACSRQMGCRLSAQTKGLKLSAIPGRGELICCGKIAVLLDYAHNGASLEALLRSARKEWAGPIWCLFGCGGNRARSRRIQMGSISGALADRTILTEDNSRTEPLANILEQLEEGVRAVGGDFLVIPDRALAIRRTICSAPEGTLVILTGKGRENCLERNGACIAFSDPELAREAFESREAER